MSETTKWGVWFTDTRTGDGCWHAEYGFISREAAESFCRGVSSRGVLTAKYEVRPYIPGPTFVADETDCLRAELAAHQDAVRVLGMCVEARRREKVAREGFHVADPTKQTHSHRDWVKAIEDRFTADGLVDANPIAAEAIAAAGKKEEQG